MGARWGGCNDKGIWGRGRLLNHSRSRGSHNLRDYVTPAKPPMLSTSSGIPRQNTQGMTATLSSFPKSHPNLFHHVFHRSKSPPFPSNLLPPLISLGPNSQTTGQLSLCYLPWQLHHIEKNPPMLLPVSIPVKEKVWYQSGHLTVKVSCKDIDCELTTI